MKTALDRAQDVIRLQIMKIELQERITHAVTKEDGQLMVDLKLQRISLRRDIHVASIMMNSNIADELLIKLDVINSTIRQLDRI